MDNYFTNLTAEHKRIYANFLIYLVGKGNPPEQTDEEVIINNAGNSHVEVLYDDDEFLLILSVDTGIRVMSVIRKNNFESSKMVELREMDYPDGLDSW
jgi:hypothetical protein